ncbi:uncharacterized protein LACBIDRAFT_306577 [Laccaria bicolor S238N-H82]|uniref:Predicted protein n=1 Tax=Laccaria bicolor (strain S238N-H82 / ATCC MYA-4686) TaxID=486041 RepID=B0DNC8_LACBS|nr:uncharacterized protein LACBIDRAFT_306577 [Laccaria bicolor S238N-H82]EDR03848.1 predicted protein [Laccaria bicolor S238N-H82]|eukprot:XP_001885416.1 predicted protein [Laccaria bicolor S238N-H82]
MTSLFLRRPISAFDKLSPPSTTCFRLRRTVSSINDPPPSFDECLLASPPYYDEWSWPSPYSLIPPSTNDPLSRMTSSFHTKMQLN